MSRALAMTVVALTACSAAPSSSDVSDPASVTRMSAGTTGAGLAVIAAGIAARSTNEAASNATIALGTLVAVYGPSAGRDYVDDPGPWWPLRLRLAGVGLAVASAFAVDAECADLDPCPGHPTANVLFGSAAAVIVAGAIWDIVTTADAARRYNVRHGTSPLTLTSTLVPGGAGIAVGGAL